MASFPSTGGISTPNGINPLTYPMPGSRKVSAMSTSGALSPTRRRSHLRSTADSRSAVNGGSRSPEKMRKALTAGVRTLPKIERGESNERRKRSPSKERK